MNKKTFKVLIIIAMISNIVLGQNDNPVSSNHDISYDLGSSWVKEKLLIPKVHKGTINSLSYRFESNKEIYYSVKLVVGYGKLKTELESEKVSLNGQINLDYSMGFKIWSTEKVKYLLGYNVEYNWSFLDFPVWDEARSYWNTNLSAGPYNRLAFSLKNNKFWITTWYFSLFGILSRPDKVRLYAQQEYTFSGIVNATHSDFEFVSINNILISNFKTEYRIPMKKGRYFSLTYTFIYSKTAKSNEPALFINRNNFGLGFGL